MYELIKKWKVNQTMLASKMGMALGYFKTKMSPNQKAYGFTEEETERLRGILAEMGKELMNVKPIDKLNLKNQK